MERSFHIYLMYVCISIYICNYVTSYCKTYNLLNVMKKKRNDNKLSIHRQTLKELNWKKIYMNEVNLDAM